MRQERGKIVVLSEAPRATAYRYIRSGYRVQHTFLEALTSLWRYHNETWNVWTHLMGFGYFVSLQFHVSMMALPTLGLNLERWPLYVFICTALACMGSSAAYHLFGTANERWADRLGAFDYAGIVLLIFGSCVPFCYYGFYASAFYQHLYIWSLLGCGSALFTCIFQSFFYHARWRTLRVGLFVGFGALGVVPLLHLLVFHRYNALSISLLGGVVGEGGVYLGGALIYTTQVPEALVPNRFDYSLNSHNLWHCCVVAAAYLHFKTMVELWEATSMAIGAAGV